jgi:hypothetical protein
MVVGKRVRGALVEERKIRGHLMLKTVISYRNWSRACGPPFWFSDEERPHRVSPLFDVEGVIGLLTE